MTKNQRKYTILQKALFLLKSGSLFDSALIQLYMINLNIFEIFIILIRLYRIILQTRYLYEMLPLFNPYYWPLCVVNNLTNAYVEFWERVFPRFKIFKVTIDVSILASLDVLVALIDILSVGAAIMLNQVNLRTIAIAEKYQKFING